MKRKKILFAVVSTLALGAAAPAFAGEPHVDIRLVFGLPGVYVEAPPSVAVYPAPRPPVVVVHSHPHYYPRVNHYHEHGHERRRFNKIEHRGERQHSHKNDRRGHDRWGHRGD